MNQATLDIAATNPYSSYPNSMPSMLDTEQRVRSLQAFESLYPLSSSKFESIQIAKATLITCSNAIDNRKLEDNNGFHYCPKPDSLARCFGSGLEISITIVVFSNTNTTVVLVLASTNTIVVFKNQY